MGSATQGRLVMCIKFPRLPYIYYETSNSHQLTACPVLNQCTLRAKKPCDWHKVHPRSELHHISSPGVDKVDPGMEHEMSSIVIASELKPGEVSNDTEFKVVRPSLETL